MIDSELGKPGLGVIRPALEKENRLVVILSMQSKGQGRLLEDQVYRFQKNRLVIGSVVSSDVRLTGDGIAPIHAVIEINEGAAAGTLPGATVYDLASDTGVFVNGAKVVTHALKPGDLVTIGRYNLKFDLQEIGKLSTPREKFRESEGRRLFLNPNEDLAPLLLQDEREVNEIFDYRPTSKTALEVVMSWHGTILRVEHFVGRYAVTVGNGKNNDFGIPPLLSSGRFPIVTQMGGAYQLNFDTQMGGVIQRQGRLLPLEQARLEAAHTANGFQLVFEKNDFAKIRIGEIDFYLSFTAAPPRLKLRRPSERDPLFFKIMASSMLLTAVTLLALMNIRVPQTIEAEQLPDRIATILYSPEKYAPKPKPPVVKPVVQEKQPQAQPTPEKTTRLEITPGAAKDLKKPPKQLDLSKKQAEKAVAKKVQGQDQSKEGKGARAKGKEGKRGTPNAPKAAVPQAKASRPSPQGGEGRGDGNSQILDEGNVDLLKGASSKIQNLLGNSAAHLGKGGSKLAGFGAFNTMGTNGLALTGTGRGGGGTAESLGGLSDTGRGGGRVGTGMGAAGTGNGIVGGKARVVIRSGGPEEAVVMGSIDAAAVEAALLAHKDEFRVCYEKEINAETPKLSGRVGTSFVIGQSGRVAQAGIESTTLKNANVERCLLTVIKRIDFPVPRGGGIVQVVYPFKFAALGR